MFDTPGALPPGNISDPSPRSKKRPRQDAEVEAVQKDNSSMYKPFSKSGYTRVYPENMVSAEYMVFVESEKEGERLGNKNPDYMNHLFKDEIKGVVGIKRINANKIGVCFGQSINANNFLMNVEFLRKQEFKAHIPARSVETIGVLRFVPTTISNEELFKKLSAEYEIISVRRFTRKVNGDIVPFTSVSVTFMSQTLPDYVYLDLYRFKVNEYRAPLLQCFKCFRFNHGAKFCKGSQKCSICSEDHHFSECQKEAEIKCINCHGPHLAISRDCPVKKNKIEENINRQNYAKVAASFKNKENVNIVKNYNSNFPPLKRPKTQTKAATTPLSNDIPMQHISKENMTLPTISNATLINEVLKSNFVLNGMVGALVKLANGNLKKINASVVQEVLVKSLQNNG